MKSGSSSNSCTERQKELVDKIYNVHEHLRKEYRKNTKNSSEVEGWKEAWEIHKQNLAELKEYSSAMHELATEVWDPRNVTHCQDQDVESPERVVQSEKLNCRIEWVYVKCKEYFPGILSSRRLKLLDVGSCYCPFEKYPATFEITAVDLCPAPGFESKVFQCDFLEVRVGESQEEEEGRRIVSLPREFFDAVVFSFFLEYLPDRRQRLESCRKAVGVLRTGGILFVIRPDSSMTEGNVRLMKEMKVGMALLGMRRLAIEKLRHMWCTAFVKLSEEEGKEFKGSKRFLNDLGKVRFLEESELFAIPQDFKIIKEEVERGEEEREEFDPLLFEGMTLLD